MDLFSLCDKFLYYEGLARRITKELNRKYIVRDNTRRLFFRSSGRYVTLGEDFSWDTQVLACSVIREQERIKMEFLLDYLYEHRQESGLEIIKYFISGFLYGLLKNEISEIIISEVVNGTSFFVSQKIKTKDF